MPCLFVSKINSFKIPEITKIPKIPKITEPIKLHVIIFVKAHDEPSLAEMQEHLLRLSVVFLNPRRVFFMRTLFP